MSDVSCFLRAEIKSFTCVDNAATASAASCAAAVAASAASAAALAASVAALAASVASLAASVAALEAASAELPFDAAVTAFNTVVERILAAPKYISLTDFDTDKRDLEEKARKGNDLGVIAQEIKQIAPEIVTERENGYLAVDYEKIVPLLIEAIKELSAKVKELENRCKQEETLQINETLYRVLLEKLPQKIFYKDRNSEKLAALKDEVLPRWGKKIN